MSQSEWQQVRTYTDHLGHRVVLEQYVTPDYEPDTNDIIPIQVYSLVPLDDDHKNLRIYLMQSFFDEEVKPLFEIYSYSPPDNLACIEHNRIEIARRKQQHGSEIKDPLPLIPQFVCPDDYSSVGLCVLLRSHSYRLGYVEDSDAFAELGEGSDLLYFNRCFSSTCVNMTQPESEDDESPLLEGFELAIQCVTDQTYIDEGSFPSRSDQSSEEQIHDQLVTETSVGGFDLHPDFWVSEEANIVTVKNTPEGKTPDIQYIIHAAFLSFIRDTVRLPLLQCTARLFTASISSHLPADKSLNLKFFIPDSLSFSAIRPAQNEVLKILSEQTEEDPENSFLVGALHKVSTGDDQLQTWKHVTPQIPEQQIITGQGRFCEPFRLFAVVLDRANFVSESGVYFYMAYLDGSENPGPSMEDAPDDTQVVRGVDMSTVAGRLGMLVLDG
ncbi:uncharacterized protein N7506_007841 [Penicillium brevicompactum]|uniref:uncharacterized protein n=2 Tax=cellular organisms TaxID=131567 RepID=UPI00253F9DE5|nr:uncharacterized protein N7506_007841 [Penicillium brevicompactum]KAJ5334058.1 hypothetical protein N7506_007841 [Penicillium brevicompactum]